MIGTGYMAKHVRGERWRTPAQVAARKAARKRQKKRRAEERRNQKGYGDRAWVIHNAGWRTSKRAYLRDL